MTRQHLVKVLLVVEPSSIRAGLLALLHAIPDVVVLQQTSTVSTALEVMAKYRPDLVLLHGGLTNDNSWQMLRRLKADWPMTPCIMLVQDVQQVSAAKKLGAELAMLSGFPASKLITVIEEIVRQQYQASKEMKNE